MKTSLLCSFLLFASICSAQSVVATQRQGLGYQFVNKQTQSPVSNLIWDEAEPFVNGFARVLKNDHFSFVDINGKPICETQFEGARNFSNKLAAVKKNAAWGFIDQSGKAAIPFQYEIVFDFKETVTAVLKNKKWLLINTKGELIKELNISVFYGFNNGQAKIEKDGRPGTMNTKGEITFTPIVNKPAELNIPYSRSTNATSNCPDNIDFEFGSFLNWKCFIGKVDSVGNTNVITVNPSPPTPNRHTLYSRVLPSPIDAFGLFPVNPPDGSNFAVRLGNTGIGAQAERIQYAIRVPANDSNFSIKYDYAVVFEDPGHTTWTQPRFTVKLLDSATNTYVDCASFEYISTSNLPGFARSTVDTGVVYKPWSSVFVSLRGYAGKTMFLEFTTADCVRRGHWGYAYIDVEKPCGQSIQMQYECTAPNITNLTGPPGFQTYNWWNSTFTTLLGTGQHVVLNPGPPANTTIWLEMIPFNDFGCRDTLAVKITGVFTANFSLSDTVGVCAPHTFTFYNSNLPSTAAIWDFGDGSTAMGDTVTHTYLLPGNFTVTLDVELPSGCVGTVQKTVSILQPVGSFYFNGAYFCNSQQVQFDAVVSDADSLFWDFGDGIILPTTQLTVFHTYALPGLYLPFLTVQSAFGCQNTLPGPDTIRIEKLKAGFFDTQRKICGSTTIHLTDTSYSYFGINSYDWDFGDGTSGSGNTVSHTYTVTGTYNIQLTITGISGCTDVITKPVYVQVNQAPVAAITAPLVQCGFAPVTFTSVIQSVDAVNLINWTATNGDSGSGNTFTVNFTSAGNYDIQLIVGTVNGCYDTATYSITINPSPDVTQPNDQGLCNGSATSAINFTGSLSGAVYNWTNNDPSIGLAANGTGDIASFTGINNTAFPVTATITVTPSLNGCTGPAKTFTITISPAPDVAQPANQSLCANSPTASIIFTGSVPGTIYNWTNNNTSIGLAASGSGNIASFNAINNTGVPVMASIIVRPIVNGCPGPAKIFAITVNPTPDITQPNSQDLCEGTSTTDIHFTGTMSGAIYSWTNDNPSIGLAANGSGDIASFITVNNTVLPVIATITVSTSANGCPGTSQTFTITVNPKPDVAQPADQSLCSGSSTAAINFTGTVSNTTYSWTNDNTSTGLAASGNGPIPSFTVINNTAVPVTSNITVTPLVNGCNGTAKTFAITVNPVPDVAQPNDQLICNASTTSAINFTGTVTSTSYSWTNSDPSIGLAANGTGNIPSFTGINNTSAPVISTITVTPSANGCPGTAITFTITVNPEPDVNQPANGVFCKNDPVTAIVFTGPVSGTVYNWANNNTGIGLAANGIGDIPSFTAINNTTQPITATITVSANVFGCASPAKVFTITVNPMPAVTQPGDLQLCNGATTSTVYFATAVTGATFSWTNDNPSIGLAASGSGDINSFTAINNTNASVIATISVTATANGCPGTPATFTITVDPTASVSQPADQVVCNGALTAAIGFTGPVNGSSFNWINDNTAIGLAATGLGDIISFTAINNTNTDITATVTVTAIANGCPGPAKTFTITVKPSADVSQPVNQVLCNGTLTSAISFTGSVSNSTYSWINDNPAIGLMATGVGTIPSFAAMNPGNTVVIATISVTPIANGCPGTPKTFTIKVNPTPTVAQPADQVLCNGGSTNAITFSGLVNGTAYNWSNNNPAIGLAATGTGDIASFLATNITNAVSTATITVEPVANSCPGTDKIFLILVKPSPNVIQPVNQALCNGAATTAIIFSSTQTGSTFNWINNTPSIGLAASGTGNIASFNAFNTTDTTVTALISVMASANGCTGAAKNAAITVNPTPDVIATNDINVCLGRTVQLSASGAAQYSWSPATGLSCSNCANPVTTPADSISYLVMGTSAAGCVAYDSVSLRIIKPFELRVGPGDTLCIGESTGLKAMQANTYLWSPPNGLNQVNIAEPTATPQVTTLYQVIGYDAYNCFTDTGHILVKVGPRPTVDIGADINTSTGAVMTLHSTTSNGPIVSYSWTPAAGLSCADCPNPITTVSNNIEYTLTVKNIYGCFARDNLRLTAFCRNSQVFIPNAFTPDGDGLNDILMVRGTGITIKTFRIFNRWGELVFERKDFNPNDPRSGWDGKVRGVPASPDVFVYTAEVVCDNGIIYTYKGNTTILK